MFACAGKNTLNRNQKLNIVFTACIKGLRAGSLQQSSSINKELLGLFEQNIPIARGISTTTKMSNKLLTLETLNPNIKNVEYAVRGPIVQLASKLEKELEQVCWEKFLQ